MLTSGTHTVIFRIFESIHAGEERSRIVLCSVMDRASVRRKREGEERPRLSQAFHGLQGCTAAFSTTGVSKGTLEHLKLGKLTLPWLTSSTPNLSYCNATFRNKVE